MQLAKSMSLDPSLKKGGVALPGATKTMMIGRGGSDFQPVHEENSDIVLSLLQGGDYASAASNNNTIPKRQRKGSKKGPSAVLGQDPNASSGKKMSLNKKLGADLKSVTSKHTTGSEYQKRPLHHKKSLITENISQFNDDDKFDFLYRKLEKLKLFE